MQKTLTVGSFPAAGQPITMPDDFVSVVAVLYRDGSRITHDVSGLKVDGNNISAEWPEDTHADCCVKVVYVAKDEEVSESAETVAPKRGKR